MARCQSCGLVAFVCDRRFSVGPLPPRKDIPCPRCDGVMHDEYEWWSGDDDDYIAACAWGEE